MKIIVLTIIFILIILLFLAFIICCNNTLCCYFFCHKEWVLWEKVIENFDKKIFNFKYDTGDVSYYIKIDNFTYRLYHWADGSVSLHGYDEFCLSTFDKYHQKKLRKLFEKRIIKMKALILLFFIILFFGITYYAMYREKKDWNNGICPICGNKLRQFYTNLQGDDGWTCDNCDYTTWVSYHKFVYKK